MSLQLLAADVDPNLYIVENVAVSITAKSPVEARNLAVKTARRDAFSVLLARLSLESKIAGKINDEDMTDMVRSEQIIDEKISGNNYSASINITFAKDFVDHVLASKSSQKVDTSITEKQSEESKFLVIPVKILQKKILLWEGSNDWRVAISKALEGKDNFKIPVADIDNIAILNSENVNKVKASDLEPLFSKYQSDEVYFLLFSRDNVSNKVSVTVRSLGRLSKSQSKLSFVNSEDLDGQELLNKVANKTVEYLEGTKGSEAKLQSRADQVIMVEIPISKLGDWLMIKSKIESANIANKIKVEAISGDFVRASIMVINRDSDIVESFAKAGFSLTPKAQDLYLLQIAN